LHDERHNGRREGGKVIQDKEGMRKLTREINAAIERNLRAEILHERKAMLETELAKVRGELGQLGQPRKVAVRRPILRARKPAKVARATPKPGPTGRRVKGNSTRGLIIRTLKYAKRPMTIKELTKAVLRKGWKTERKDPSRTIDAALRKNPRFFRHTAPGTFELIR
jgi:hypothetical protein